MNTFSFPIFMGFPDVSVGKATAYSAGDPIFILMSME